MGRDVVEGGVAPADAAEHWGTSSVTRRIKRLYANRLGGNWDLEGTGPVANWRRQIADVRNSAIHTRREVTSAEVNAADVAAGALTTFMAQRILANWRKYPKTMSVLLGPSSVEQHVSTQARDAVLGKCSAATRLPWSSTVGRDDWFARRSYPLDSIFNDISQFLLHRNRIERDRPAAATSRTL